MITFAAAAVSSGKAETQESEKAPPSGEKEDNDAKSATMTSSSTRDLKGETEIESPQHEDKVNSSNSSSENLQEVEQASQEDVEPTEEGLVTNLNFKKNTFFRLTRVACPTNPCSILIKV